MFTCMPGSDSYKKMSAHSLENFNVMYYNVMQCITL